LERLNPFVCTVLVVFRKACFAAAAAMCQEQLLDHKHNDEAFDEGRIAFECTYTGREPPELVDLFQVSRSTTTLWSVLVLLGTSWYQGQSVRHSALLA